MEMALRRHGTPRIPHAAKREYLSVTAKRKWRKNESGAKGKQGEGGKSEMAGIEISALLISYV